MNRRQLLASLGLAGLSGCLRLQSDNTPTPTSGSDRGASSAVTPSATPQSDASTEASTGGRTQSPDDSSTQTPAVDYPLGLTPDGPEPILAEVHRNELVERSFEVQYELEDVVHGGFVENYTQRASDDYRVEINHGRQNDLIRFSTSHDDMWWRQLVDGAETFGYNHWGQSKAALSHSWEIEPYLVGGQFGSPTVQETDTGPVFTVTADGVADGSVFSTLPYVDSGSIETLEAEARVTGEGVITDFVAEFQWVPADRDELRKHRVSFAISAMGITVSEPDWLVTARERAPSATVSLTDDRRYVTVRHDGGNPIVAGSQFAFRAPPENDAQGIVHAKQIQTPFEAGQTAYVYLQDGDMAVNIGGRPDSASPTELTENYRAFAEVGSAPYFPPTPIQ